MKLKKSVLTMALALTLCASPLSASAAVLSLTEPANMGMPSISPLSDAIIWRYKIENGKIYKRLYDATTSTYIGDWIYVGEYRP